MASQIYSDNNTEIRKDKRNSGHCSILLENQALINSEVRMYLLYTQQTTLSKNLMQSFCNTLKPKSTCTLAMTDTKPRKRRRVDSGETMVIIVVISREKGMGSTITALHTSSQKAIKSLLSTMLSDIQS